MNQVILVDAYDQAIGVADKLQAHQQGWLHRAFSVFIVRSHCQQREVLLQQRQINKYHGGGLWTNTCCSHPQPGETVIAAAERRLQEELGFSLPLTEIGLFTYRAEFANGLIEHEVDHVLMGEFNDSLEIKPNQQEVMAYRWLTLKATAYEAQAYPAAFTPWFTQALMLLDKYAA